MSDIRVRFVRAAAGFSLDVDLTLPARGVTGIAGPSGAGKTSLLRLIAGLDQASHGLCSIGGSVWQDGDFNLPAHQRPVGVVFQDARLFPQLTVQGNLDFGIRRIAADQQPAARVELSRLVELLGLGDLLERRVQKLSGGEAQRVAIARALALRPKLLLMDEPLAALDTARREEILPYLERLQRRLEIPVLYVSHATDELARLADHLVLLERGQVRGQGSLIECLTRLDLPLAHARGAETMLLAEAREHDARFALTRFEFPGGSLWLPQESAEIGAAKRLRVLAADVSLALSRPPDSSILNILPARVTELAPSGASQMLVKLDLQGSPLLARITLRSADTLALRPGLEVFAQIKGVAILGSR